MYLIFNHVVLQSIDAVDICAQFKAIDYNAIPRFILLELKSERSLR